MRRILLIVVFICLAVTVQGQETTPESVPSATPTMLPVATGTPSVTATSAATSTLPATATVSSTATMTATSTATSTWTPTATFTSTMTPSVTSTQTATPLDSVATIAPGETVTATASAVPIASSTPSATPTVTLTSRQLFTSGSFWTSEQMSQRLTLSDSIATPGTHNLVEPLQTISEPVWFFEDFDSTTSPYNGTVITTYSGLPDRSDGLDVNCSELLNIAPLASLQEPSACAFYLGSQTTTVSPVQLDVTMQLGAGTTGYRVMGYRYIRGFDILISSLDFLRDHQIAVTFYDPAGAVVFNAQCTYQVNPETNCVMDTGFPPLGVPNVASVRFVHQTTGADLDLPDGDHYVLYFDDLLIATEDLDLGSILYDAGGDIRRYDWNSELDYGLITETTNDIDPVFSPDGSLYAFVRGGNLYLGDPNSSTASLIVQDATEPDWSPGGLAFVHNGQICIDSTTTCPIVSGSSPGWSPDGSQLAYSDNGQLYIYDVAANTETLLTDGTHPAWRPDGQWMAFTRNGEIWVHRFSDGFEGTLAPGSHAAWSPDDVGRWLAYEHNGDIRVYNAGSGGIQTYISGGSRPTWGYPQDPAVCPAGTFNTGGGDYCVEPSPTSAFVTNTPIAPTATPTGTPFVCLAQVLAGDLSARMTASDGSSRYFYVDNQMQIITDANTPSGWQNGDSVQIQVDSWAGKNRSTSDGNVEFTWLTVTIQNLTQPTSIQEAYMALREDNIQTGATTDYLQLSCEESTLPGWQPEPTPTPTPTSVPQENIRYVVCQRAADPPNEPYILSVRTQPDPNSVKLGEVTDGEMVILIRLDRIAYGNNIEYVEIQWSGSPTGSAYVVISTDTNGDYLTATRQIECDPAIPTATPTSMPPPTPTPNPDAVYFDRGPFVNYDTVSPFGNNIPPAQVGSLGVHREGTLDVMPRHFPDGRLVNGQNLEHCIDSALGSQCDPTDGGRYTVFSPVTGNIYYTKDNATILINNNTANAINLGGRNIVDANGDFYPMTAQISLSHLHPDLYKVGHGGAVNTGTEIGVLCRSTNIADNCNLLDENSNDTYLFVRLAYEVRFRFDTPQLTRKFFGIPFLNDWCRDNNVADNECNAIKTDWNQLVRAVIANPNCLYNEWLNSGLSVPNSNQPVVCAE